MDVSALQAEMAAGRFTAVALLRHCPKRIEAMDRSGPRLRAVIELNPDAMAQSRLLDAERRGKAPTVRGPLHGIPVTIKDLTVTAGIPTERGSHITKGQVPDTDAPFVTRMKQAGAIVLGKTTTSEFGWTGVSRISPCASPRRPPRAGSSCRAPISR